MTNTTTTDTNLDASDTLKGNAFGIIQWRQFDIKAG